MKGTKTNTQAWFFFYMGVRACANPVSNSLLLTTSDLYLPWSLYSRIVDYICWKVQKVILGLHANITCTNSPTLGEVLALAVIAWACTQPQKLPLE